MKGRSEAARERTEKKPRREEPVSTDPDAIRSLVLSDLPSDITKAVLWKRVRKIHDNVELRFPVEGEEAKGGNPRWTS